MATKDELAAAAAARADGRLQAVSLTNRNLPEILEEWDDLADGERASLALDWDHMMGSYLPELVRYHRAGVLSEEQEEAYERLKQELEQNLPVIEKLNFYRPSFTEESRSVLDSPAREDVRWLRRPT